LLIWKNDQCKQRLLIVAAGAAVSLPLLPFRSRNQHLLIVAAAVAVSLTSGQEEIARQRADKHKRKSLVSLLLISEKPLLLWIRIDSRC